MILFSLLCTSGCFPDYTWPAALTSHEVTEVNQVETLWQLSEVIVRDTWSRSPLVAASGGNVFFLGRLGREVQDAVFALNDADGSLLWTRESLDLWTVSVTPDGLFVGESGLMARVSRYDLHTGEQIWRKYAWGNSVPGLLVDDHKVSANFNPDLFCVYHSESGKVLRIAKTDDPIYLVTSENTYRRSPQSMGTLQAIRTDSGKTLWEIEVGENIYRPPAFTKDAIYIRTERSVGAVYAVERNSGAVLWQTERDVISNVSAGSGLAFMILEDGLFVGLDQQTGQIKASARFSSGPFIVNGPDAVVDGYYTAFDPETGMAFAFIGDSQQLFAFKLEQSLR